MQVGQGVTDLPNPGQGTGFFQGHAGLFQDCLQIIAFDKVHHQVLTLSGDYEMVGHARQVGMGEASQDHRFTLELALSVWRGVQVFFQSTGMVEGSVPGAIDRAKTALPKQFDDPVALVEHLALDERHREIIIQNQPVKKEAQPALSATSDASGWLRPDIGRYSNQGRPG